MVDSTTTISNGTTINGQWKKNAITPEGLNVLTLLAVGQSNERFSAIGLRDTDDALITQKAITYTVEPDGAAYIARGEVTFASGEVNGNVIAIEMLGDAGTVMARLDLEVSEQIEAYTAITIERIDRIAAG